MPKQERRGVAVALAWMARHPVATVVIIIAVIIFAVISNASQHPAAPDPVATLVPAVTPAPGTPAPRPHHHRHRHHHHAVQLAPPTQAPPPTPAAAAPTGCYPLSDEDTCYEPGEFCRDSDAGMQGVAGDGQAIICEDNDGLRWEPA